MAADDRYIVGPTSIANESYLTIQPDSGVEIIIKNIICADSAEVYITDGTNYILIDAATGVNSWLNVSIDITNSVYIKVKNVSGVAQYMCATGVQTK